MVAAAGMITTKAKTHYEKVARGIIIMIDFDFYVDTLSNVDCMSRRSYRPRAVAIGR